MEEKKELESGFRVLNILLLESSFSRIASVTFNDPAIKQEIDVKVMVNVKSTTEVMSTVQVVFNQIFNEEKQVSATIKMVGVFEKLGESPLNLQDFGEVNGAAIIYPYIREHLSSLSAKAGLGLIYLPPVNLTKKKQ
ncbi:MAG: protein-export chaperone SecB [Paludibacteraceae bacterium]|nr:protein-export chaperone SecB [Paludibacteraceae bacterium]